MNTWKTQLKTMLLLVSFLLIGMFVLQGCKKSEPSGSGAVAEKKQETDEHKWTCSMHPQITADKPDKCSICGMDLVPQESEHEHKAMMMGEPAKEIVSQAIEQKTCPVMEAPINRAPLNKELYTEYKGKKVYFCCPSCKERFEQAPEQYLSKLPQFNK